MSTIIGAGSGNPLLYCTSLIGGNTLGILSQDTKALNYKYTKVSDADMIILIRKVEDLQQKVVNLYYDYMSAKQQLDFANKLVEERKEKFELAQKNNAARELVVITDAQYRAAIDKQRSAKSEFFSKRAALEQFVGNETFVQFEQELAARESGEPVVKNKSVELETTAAADEDYDNTIHQVEEYTESVNAEQTVDKNPSGVADISQMPTLRGMEEAHTTSVLTGSSSNVENTTKKKGLFKKSKKAAKHQEQEEITTTEETAAKQTPKKYDKYSTKGLIFIHNGEAVQNQQPVSETKKSKKKNSKTTEEVSVSQTQSSTQYQVQTPAYSTKPSRVQQDDMMYNFAPLDEIKVPELTPGGYSIHSGY